jgi:hypothetical protein
MNRIEMRIRATRITGELPEAAAVDVTEMFDMSLVSGR